MLICFGIVETKLNCSHSEMAVYNYDYVHMRTSNNKVLNNYQYNYMKWMYEDDQF